MKLKLFVTILILVEGSLQSKNRKKWQNPNHLVTILILVEGSLQLKRNSPNKKGLYCHNPYFSRRFFAITVDSEKEHPFYCHNPYFSRRFFAIGKNMFLFTLRVKSQSLF